MVRPSILIAATLLLFTIWSNSFIAMSYLLGAERSAMRLDWVALTVARFLPAGAICLLYCLVLRRREAVGLARAHWRRLLLCGLVAVPGYNFSIYYALQHGVPAPVASLTTTLVPLFVMVLAALFLGERPTPRRLGGLAVAMAGMTLVALAKASGEGFGYPTLVLVAALAPLSWSVYSILSKPLAGRASPVVWTFLATGLGSLFVLPLLPGRVWRQWSELDAGGWAAVLYLSLPCTVLGFALWTWLLKHLPASSVAFSVFLNPPLTLVSKYVLAATVPTTFVFTTRPAEWVGGTLALTGLALAVWPRRPRP